MDFAYNDEQKEIIKVVRDLVEKEIVPYASEMDETGKLHEGSWKNWQPRVCWASPFRKSSAVPASTPSLSPLFMKN